MKQVFTAAKLATTLFLLTGCLDKSNADKLKINVHYWTYTGVEQCVNLDGVPYCFLKKDIDAASFPTDASAGFLFMAPTDDPDLVKCAEPAYRVDWENYPYPNIHMTVGELPVRKGNGLDAMYKRMLNWKLDKGPRGLYDFVKPIQYIDYYGEKCLKLVDKASRNSNREALCYGGDFNKDEPAYFWGCQKEGSEPNPSCRNDFLYKTLEYGVSSSRKCAPFMNNKLRDFAINFVEQGRKRAEHFSNMPKRSME